MILTERAEHIAAEASDGQDLLSRHEARQRLFFYWIQSYGSKGSEAFWDNPAVFIISAFAESLLSGFKTAGMGTDGAD